MNIGCKDLRLSPSKQAKPRIKETKRGSFKSRLLKRVPQLDIQFSSVQSSRSVVSDSLPPHESQHTRPPYQQLPEFTQTQVHRVSDAIQRSHPRSSPSPPAPNPSQHQSLFQRVNSLHEVAKVLEFHSFDYMDLLICGTS